MNKKEELIKKKEELRILSSEIDNLVREISNEESAYAEFKGKYVHYYSDDYDDKYLKVMSIRSLGCTTEITGIVLDNYFGRLDTYAHIYLDDDDESKHYIIEITKEEFDMKLDKFYRRTKSILENRGLNVKKVYITGERLPVYISIGNNELPDGWEPSDIYYAFASEEEFLSCYKKENPEIGFMIKEIWSKLE